MITMMEIRLASFVDLGYLRHCFVKRGGKVGSFDVSNKQSLNLGFNLDGRQHGISAQYNKAQSHAS
jgi:hypothetical protein